LENYLIAESDEDSKVELLDEHVFGEPLLLLNNQVRTKHGKRADIIALDRMGNTVIIELKRDKGVLGVETQALQYLADIAADKGKRLLTRFKNREDGIKSFLGADASLDELNRQSRIILIARAFDPSILSIGEWLASAGVAFRCIKYLPIEIGKQRFLTFSLVFDRIRESIYPLLFDSGPRNPQTFWHNVGTKRSKSLEEKNRWWQHLVEKGEISASFDNQPGDSGEQLLRKYIQGDKIIAYLSGSGALGWGVVADPKYQLIGRGDDGPFSQGGRHLHRLKGIDWKEHATNLQDALSSEQILKQFDVYHPVQTRSRIDEEKANKLIEFIKKKFGQKTAV
jgi:hypothetical protein